MNTITTAYCAHNELAYSATDQWCETCGVTLDPEDTSKALADRKAGLGVGHVWTAVQCPAYRTLRATDCTCGGAL